MPRPWRKTFEGAKYHVTCRGNGRERIVMGDDDRLRFREQLGEALVRDGVLMYAWVLMPNHYHLMVETPRGNLPGFMQRLNTAYAMYFRYKRARPGHCFQGRYGAKLVSGDDYLLRLTRYIHLNPVKIRPFQTATPEEKWKALRDYRWSSLAGYLNRHHAESYVDYRWLQLMNRRDIQGCRRAYASYVRSCVSTMDDVLGMAHGRSAYAIGDDEHVREVEDDIWSHRKDVASRGDLLLPKPATLNAMAVLGEAASVCGVTVEELRSRGRKTGFVKALAIELACRYVGTTQREIGKLLGVSEHAIGKQRARLAARLREDQELADKMATLSGELEGRMSSV